VILAFAAGWWIGRSETPGSDDAPGLRESGLEEVARGLHEQASLLKRLALLVDRDRKRLDELERRLPATSGVSSDPALASVELDIATSPSLGPDDAAVTIVEFSDFQCPHCATLATALTRSVNEYPGEVRVVFKHFPVATHKQALGAHKAAFAASVQGKFWEMHDFLFGHQDRLDDASLVEHARTLGLNAEQFEDDRQSREAAAAISADLSEAQRLGIARVPTFAINGRLLVGARTWEELQLQIEAELARSRESRADTSALESR